MINDKLLKQQGGDNSHNIQGETVNINYGISFEDARAIALQVFRENFLQLSEDAAKLARSRAEELVDDFIGELHNRNPSGVETMKDPAMQHALFVAQREYAKTGDKDLADILVDLLVDRSGLPERTLKQIVIDESIAVVSKLTSAQMDTLTIIFLVKYTALKFTIKDDLENIARFESELLRIFGPFLSSLSMENSLYQHLEYCSCVTSSTADEIDLSIRTAYPGMFSLGIAENEIDTALKGKEYLKKYVIPCFRNQKLKQIGFAHFVDVEPTLQSDGINIEDIAIVKRLLGRNLLPVDEMKKYLMQLSEGMARLVDVWNDSFLQVMTLTSVGIAIAQANFRLKVGEPIDLGIWIKD